MQIGESKYIATSNAKGRYTTTRLESGDNVVVTITKDGYMLLQKTIIVKPAQANNLDITLSAALQMVA